MSLRIASAACLALSAMFAGHTKTVAQTHEDSVVVARLIVQRAVADAQRQHTGLRTLAWAPSLRSARDTAVQSSDRLLELGTDSVLVRSTITPVCPWELTGPVEPRLRLTLGATQISRTEARADVILSCRGRGRGGSRWDFYYMIERKGAHWVITHVSKRGET